MNDLIETLKAKILDVENARGPAKHILNDRLADLGQVAWDYGDEIISALQDREALRKIERLASPFIMSIRQFEDAVFVTTQKGTFKGSTIHFAVDAAVGANKKGEK